MSLRLKKFAFSLNFLAENLLTFTIRGGYKQDSNNVNFLWSSDLSIIHMLKRSK
jgi:hypothetical protein